MTQVQSIALRLGGVGRASEYDALGIGPGLLRVATSSGELIRVRKGWYAHPGVGAEAISAIRVGGALACASAARHHGLWSPADNLHVAVPATSARLRTPHDERKRLADWPDETVIHWVEAPVRLAQSVPSCIDTVVRCCGPRAGFAVLESALHLRRIDPPGVARLRAGAPHQFRRWIDRASNESESGGESLLKDILIELGLSFRQQVVLPGIGRVDFEIGESLILEADSRAHHTDPGTDRRRDAAASASGRRTLRFLYEQIAWDREGVRAAILGAVVRGDTR